MIAETTKWIKSDSTQYVKKMNENMYELVEALELSEDVYEISHAIIDLTDYSEADILEAISTYGYKNIQVIKDEYGDESNQVIAECIFELSDDFKIMETTDVNEIIEKMATKFSIHMSVTDF